MLTLSVKTRKELGKKNKTLRGQGLIPAIIYGHKVETQPLTVGYKDFEKAYGEVGGSLLNLKIQDSKENGEVPVVIQDVSKDPVTHKFIHIDFYQVRLDEKITVSLPLVFEGEAPAVELEEGTLIKNIYELETKGFPHKLPKEIVVDISGLKTFNDQIQVKDLNLPEGVEIERDPEDVLVLVQPPRAKEEEVLEEVPEGEAVEEVKVEGEEEKVEEEKAEEKKAEPKE